MTSFTWKQGATFRMAIQVVEGEVTGDEPIRCALKRKLGSNPVGEELMEFAVSFRAAEGEEPAAWIFDASEAQGEALQTGLYVADARIEFGADTVITSFHDITLTPSVTSA